jgi:hypothetical protein
VFVTVSFNNISYSVKESLASAGILLGNNLPPIPPVCVRNIVIVTTTSFPVSACGDVH